MSVLFISGHLDLTPDEFAQHYEGSLQTALAQGSSFVLGDARGCDTLAQGFLHRAGCRAVTVFHMFEKPRNNVGGFPTSGGFKDDNQRDEAMTRASTSDLAWVRSGRERSGTAKNLLRRKGGG
jgi:hypothetical protein